MLLRFNERALLREWAVQSLIVVRTLLVVATTTTKKEGLVSTASLVRLPSKETD